MTRALRIEDIYEIRQAGDPRRQSFAHAADAYEKAVASAPKGGDIYFLSLYKLGWAYYNQATRANQEEYKRAVDVFGRLVAEYDQLTPEQQQKFNQMRQQMGNHMRGHRGQGGHQDADDEQDEDHE